MGNVAIGGVVMTDDQKERFTKAAQRLIGGPNVDAVGDPGPLHLFTVYVRGVVSQAFNPDGVESAIRWLDVELPEEMKRRGFTRPSSPAEGS